MKVEIAFERPPLRAVYKTTIEAESLDLITAAVQAGAQLQLQEARRVRVLSVGMPCRAAIEGEGNG